MAQSRFSIVLILKALNTNTTVKWTQEKIGSVWFEVTLLAKLRKSMPAKKRGWSIALPFLKRSEASPYKIRLYLHRHKSTGPGTRASKSDSICMFSLTHKSSCMQNGMNNAGTNLPEWIIFQCKPETDGLPYRNGLGTKETNVRKCINNLQVSIFLLLDFNVLIHIKVVLFQRQLSSFNALNHPHPRHLSHGYY